MQYAPVSEFSSDIQLNGQSGYFINGNAIQINIEEIANNRDFQNISGTISLELWALDQPYQGASFQGYCVAATELGELFGQHSLFNNQLNLDFQPPPAGNWNLVLMVREWDNGAYVTRDYINFSLPYLVELPYSQAIPVVTRRANDNIIEVSFGENTATDTQTAEAADDKVKPEKLVAKKVKVPGKSAKAKSKTKDEVQPVSVNEASQSDLAAVKGISRKLAEAIVESRPFKKLEDLLKVKGMGKKVLASLEGKIKL